MTEIEVFPTPAVLERGDGFFAKPAKLRMCLDETIRADFRTRGIDAAGLLPLPADGSGVPGGAELSLRLDAGREPEGYRLCVAPGGIEAECGSPAGAYYALQTLRQIFAQTSSTVPCLTVEDEPALKVRGVLIDIGRDKIPKMETLYALVDYIAAMKLNHMELYMDGYCFEWQRYRYLFTDETPVTAEEIRSLAAYAARHYVDLVPNQNSLGHMESWLAKPQFRPLAECEDGFLFQNLYRRAPGTVDVRDPRAKQFVAGLFDELLPNFTSGYVNANLDEPFELGMGKNKSCGAGREKLYTDYVGEVDRYLRSKGKKMMMWGDVVFAHPQSIADLPEDVTVLDWIYEGDGSFENDCRAIVKTGREFCLCPGTGSWCSFAGRSDNMVKNIRNAAFSAVDYGARGIIVTDWGDMGHWQYLSASYVPFAFGAGYAWSGKRLREESVFRYCDREVYRDGEGRASRTAFEFGNYYRYEHAPLYNTTLCFAVMAPKYRFDTKEEFDGKMAMMLRISANIAKGLGVEMKDPEIRLDAEGLERHLRTVAQQAASLHLESPDGELVKSEMAQSARMALHGLSLYRAMTEDRGDAAKFRQDMAFLAEDLDGVMREHYRLWKSRNRMGGFSRSIGQMLHLTGVYNKYR